jgi:4-hydroxybenzoate polyprenyltransferase
MAAATLVSALGFLFSANQLNDLCFLLAFPTLFILLGYSYCKRFTRWSHVVLGLALGIAPVGACLAIRGSFDRDTIACVALGFAVLCWTAGFDILYACQDRDHDLRAGLRSVPERYGIAKALVIARCFHALVPLFLVTAGLIANLHFIYALGLVLCVLLLIHEHRLVHARDLSRLQTAFFAVNVAISVIMMLAIALDVTLHQSHA